MEATDIVEKINSGKEAYQVTKDRWWLGYIRACEEILEGLAQG